MVGGFGKNNRRNNNKWTNSKGNRIKKNNNRAGDSNKKPYNGKQNPRRGGPGILLACETGREIKCEREGLEILRHYLYSSSSHLTKIPLKYGGAVGNEESKTHSNSGNTDATVKMLSMEDEIALLQSGASVDQVLHDINVDISSNQKSNELKRKEFTPYRTGCRGSVFIMCTLPDCNLIPPIITKDPNHRINKPNFEDNRKQIVSTDSIYYAEKGGTETDTLPYPPCKRPKVEKEEKLPLPTATNEKDIVTKKVLGCWDPVGTVRRVICGLKLSSDESDQDYNNDRNTAPRSRFVTRMIPIQATCFASLFEMEQTAKYLIEKYILPNVDDVMNNTCTFKIEFRRRNCSNVTRDQVIDKIASLLLGNKTAAESNNNDIFKLKNTKFIVNLIKPEYTIQIEICKTLCGMSVLKNAHTFQNFNLIEIQERQKSQNNTAD